MRPQAFEWGTVLTSKKCPHLASRNEYLGTQHIASRRKHTLTCLYLYIALYEFLSLYDPKYQDFALRGANSCTTNRPKMDLKLYQLCVSGAKHFYKGKEGRYRKTYIQGPRNVMGVDNAEKAHLSFLVWKCIIWKKEKLKKVNRANNPFNCDELPSILTSHTLCEQPSTLSSQWHWFLEAFIALRSNTKMGQRVRL